MVEFRRKVKMPTAQKIAMGVIAIGMATTLLLPGRQTSSVIGAFDKLIRGALGTAMGTARPA
jgi:hypothetical protein